MESNTIPLRHTVATLGYRAARAIRNAPETFSDFAAVPGDRTAGTILAHLGDLMDWGLAMAEGRPAWNNSKPQVWAQESARFFAALAAFDERLASNEPVACPLEKLFQGPIADALNHVGQIAMLRRMAGSRIGGENYYLAEITIGRVGLDQAKPIREFE